MLVRKLLTEFVGTLIFLFAIGLAVTGGLALAPLIIGTALMVLVYMGGHVSGAHYNPAVSLAILLRGKLATRELLPYWCAQILGALVGSFLASVASAKSFAPTPGGSTAAALLIELVFTFTLCLVVLHVATARATAGNSFYGAAIGMTIVVAAFAGGGISGGAFNPAVAIGATFVHAAYGGGSLGKLWIYLVGPLAGGVLASLVFRLQIPED
ncbi:MAG TPA: MIP/aquaporin family protein [Candidatus Polarisedimenticolaceae bacterium]|nr:MIP/aquaporin family protein [Candidatus Polarisedimenticolaceae bacterium]